MAYRVEEKFFCACGIHYSLGMSGIELEWALERYKKSTRTPWCVCLWAEYDWVGAVFTYIGTGDILQYHFQCFNIAWHWHAQIGQALLGYYWFPEGLHRVGHLCISCHPDAQHCHLCCKLSNILSKCLLSFSAGNWHFTEPYNRHEIIFAHFLAFECKLCKTGSS